MGNLHIGPQSIPAVVLVDEGGIPLDESFFTPVNVDRFPGVATAAFNATATAYDAGDIIDGAKMLVGLGPQNGGQVMITSSKIVIPYAAVISGQTSYTLELYTQPPSPVQADAATWALSAVDALSHACSIALGTPVDKGAALTIEANALNIQITVPPGGVLFAELVTVGAYTATVAPYYVTLHSTAV